MAQVITVTVEPQVDPNVPTVTYYQDLGAQLRKVFEQIMAVVPKMDEAEAVDARVFRVNLGVPDAFCAAAIAAVEELPELGDGRFDAAQLRNRMQFLDAFRAVVQTGMAALARIDRALQATKSVVATESLQIYRVVKGYASDNKSPLTKAHATTLRVLLGKNAGTKAERAARKEAKFQERLEKEIAERHAKGLLTVHKEVEVPKAA